MYCVFICLPAARRAAAAASPGHPTVAEQSLRIGWTEMSSARPPRRRPRGGEAVAVGSGANRGAAVDVGMQSYASRGGGAVAHGGGAATPLSEKSQTECHVTKLEGEPSPTPPRAAPPRTTSSPNRHVKVHLFQTRM